MELKEKIEMEKYIIDANNIKDKITEIHRDDKILDNGIEYILITQLFIVDGYIYHPYVPKETFNKLLNEGRIKLSEEKYKTEFGDYDLYEFVFDNEEM